MSLRFADFLCRFVIVDLSLAKFLKETDKSLDIDNILEYSN